MGEANGKMISLGKFPNNCFGLASYMSRIPLLLLSSAQLSAAESNLLAEVDLIKTRRLQLPLNESKDLCLKDMAYILSPCDRLSKEASGYINANRL